jgi:hypothetical protein
LTDSLKNSTESTREVLSQVSKTAEQSVAKSAEALERAIAQLLGELGTELDKKLDPPTPRPVSASSAALLDDYAKVTAKVREDLDLTNPQSPLSALRSELYKDEERRYEALAKQLGDLLQQSAARAAASAERAKSTHKGGDFETATEEFLTAESRPRKDLVRRTGTEYGLDQNMIGDFAIEINPGEAQGTRIVIESKNAHKHDRTSVRARQGDAIRCTRHVWRRTQQSLTHVWLLLKSSLVILFSLLKVRTLGLAGTTQRNSDRWPVLLRIAAPNPAVRGKTNV